MLIQDLHCHTTASDGTLSPKDLIDRAVKKGVTHLAITDHDTIAGSLEAQTYITEQGKALILWSGVELSTNWNSHAIHIVGLKFEVSNPIMNELLERQQLCRILRAEKITLKLGKAIGVENLYEAICEQANTLALGRLHIAQWLLNNGYVKNIQQAFQKYLKRGQSAYVANQWCSIEEAIETIHTAGGVAILAHPSRYKFNNKWLQRLLTEFKQAGGDAMEIAYGRQQSADRFLMGRFAKDYNLQGSQGSDFHYPDGNVELGHDLWIPTSVTPVWKDWLTESN